MIFDQRNIQRTIPQCVERHGCCGGELRFYKHYSSALALEARFGIFLPEAAIEQSVSALPALYLLAGLTCTEETFLIKSNAVRFAAEHGIVLIAPDTSPRGAGSPGEDEAYDLGTGAGYYVDATAEPWAQHYRMAQYVGQELPNLLEGFLPVDGQRCGIMGHSMGGAGALGFALRQPEKWKSVSAFAPIASPSRVGWGQKATEHYFGGHSECWEHYDPVLLLQSGKCFPGKILVDQGMEDQFLTAYLRPELLEQAAQKAGQKLTLRRHPGYDHSYWFIQSFIADHMEHHVRALSR